jgi:hypothetical protein
MPRTDYPQPYHRQVLACNGDQVDEGIVDLLEALWEAGLGTQYSCQDWGAASWTGGREANWESGRPGWAYIRFTDEPAAKLFCSDLREHYRYGHPSVGGNVFVAFQSTDIDRLTTLWRYRAARKADVH